MNMKRTLSLFALLSAAASAQPTPQFGPTDIHSSAHTVTQAYIRGPFLRSGRYEIRQATMVDLIRTAYGVDEDKVLSGPAWLETDRFDVSAKLPAEVTPENLKLALQALLADRFKLVVHNDTKPLQAYVLSVGKKSLLKEADASGEPGCKNTTQPGGRGGGAVMIGGSGPVAFNIFACRNVTIEAFVKALGTNMGMATTTLSGTPVVDQTGLKGAWDFDVKISPLRIGGGGADVETITIFDAVDKQLGLKLQMQKVPQPVVVVDSVNNKPTDNPPGITASLPTAAAEFDVADVKPTDPSAGPGITFNIQPGGLVNLKGMTMKTLIQQAYGAAIRFSGNDTIVGAPKWFDNDRFDIIAKVAPIASATGAANAPVDADTVWLALRALLVDRFKLAAHIEDQPQPTYVLTAVRPKLTKADPSNRTSCKTPNTIKVLTSSGPGGASTPATLTCQNITMAHFAEILQQSSLNDVTHPVVDGTGLEGSFDITVSWSPAIMGQMMAASRARVDAAAAGGPDAASDPGGGVSMIQALEKLGLKLDLQKRPQPVLVIDHVEQKPTDN